MTEKENRPDDTFTINSFYGKREKKCFPHSPKRRKAADKVLEKISDENTDSENETVRKSAFKNRSGKKLYEFHSSASADSDTDPENVRLTRQSKQSARKVPLKLKHSHVDKTPKVNVRSRKQVISYSTGKIIDRTEPTKVEERIQPLSEKKFFKCRSPGDTYKSLRSLFIVKKGFDVKFVPRKSVSDLNKKTSRGPKSAKSKTKVVGKVKAVEMRPFKDVGVEMSVSTDDKSKQLLVMREREDSGLDSANSCDLFASSNVNNGENSCTNTDDDDGTISLISALDTESNPESEDLFSTAGSWKTPKSDMASITLAGTGQCGRNTPDSMVAGASLQESLPSSSAEYPRKEPQTPESTGQKYFPIFNSRHSTPPNSNRKLRYSIQKVSHYLYAVYVSVISTVSEFGVLLP